MNIEYALKKRVKIKYDCKGFVGLHALIPYDYFVDYECFDRWNDEPEYIYCSGKVRISTIDDLKKYININT